MENDSQEEISIPLFIKPDFILRIKSMVIDSLVIIILLFIAFWFCSIFNIESANVKALLSLMIVLYEPIFTSHSRTFGQKMMKIQVRNFAHIKNGGAEQNIGFLASLFRYLIKLLLGWISLLTIHSDQYGRAIHDKFANSVMTFK